MWVKMGTRLLNLDRFTEIRRVREADGKYFVWLVDDYRKIALPMDSAHEAETFITDIAEWMRDGNTVMYWYSEAADNQTAEA